VRPLVLKFGGELLEDPERLNAVVSAVRDIAGSTPLAIGHGGGREIDAALKTAGIEKRQIEGLRITDDSTLAVVVSVLAGLINTRFVAALTTAGVGAVGLTGADASCGLSDVAPPHRTVDGRVVELGAVGVPAKDADIRVVETLLDDGFVPVLACIGLGRDRR
jgi:acetylglutamate kinase